MNMRVWLLIAAVFLLPGCSLAEEVGRSADYADKAAVYIQEAKAFAENIPPLAEKALTDPQVHETIRGELEKMKQSILEFNAADAPALAAEIHRKLMDYNGTLLQEINGYIDQINRGILDFQTLIESPMLQTIRNLAELLNQLESLGL